MAASSGKIEIVRLLYAKHIDLNAEDINGENSIHYCCRCPNVDAARQIIEFLAAHGVPLDVQNKVSDKPSRTLCVSLSVHGTRILKNGETALHIASRYGYTDIIRFMCESSANLDLQDDVSATCLALFDG
jgi:ankyrin repeat protein